MGRAVWLAPLFALLACAEGERLVLALPDGARDPTFILDVDGRELYVGTASAAVAPIAAEAALELALYSEPPEALGLGAGILEPSRDCRSCSLTRPRAVYARSPALDGTWRALAAPSAAMLDRVVRDALPRCSCHRFEAQLVPVPLARKINVVAAVRDQDGSVLVVADDGSIARVREDGSAALVCGISTPLVGAAAAAPGRLWLATTSSIAELVLSEQRATSPCAVGQSFGAPIQAGERLRWIASAEGWALAVGTLGTVVERDERGGRELGRLETTGEPIVYAYARGQGVAFDRGSDQLLWIDGGRVARETPSPGDAVLVALRSAQGTPLVVTGIAGVFERHASAWRPLDIPGWTGLTGALVFEGQLIAFLVHGNFVELMDDGTQCPQQPPFTDERVFRHATLGATSFVAADVISADDRPSAVGLVRSVPWCP